MSKSYKIAGLVAGLLALMVATQYVTGTTPEDLNANKVKPKSENEADHESTHTAGGKVVLPKPIGPKDAAVKIKVYITSDNTCDTSTLDSMKGIAKQYGDKVRLEFVDILDKDKAAEAQKAKISCKSGLTLNGLSIMRIPGYGVRGLVMFDGPMEGGKNYGVREVQAGVEYLLKKKAEGKGKQKQAGGKAEG